MSGGNNPVSNVITTALTAGLNLGAGATVGAVKGPSTVVGALSPKIPTLGAAPAVAAPPVMPLPDDAAIEEAKRKAMALRAASQGRASTLLSQTTPQTALSQTLGG